MEFGEAVRDPKDAARRAIAKAHRIAGRYGPYDVRDLEPEPFVRYAFRIVLQRDVEPSALQNYVEHLTSGRYSRDDVIDELISSTEFNLGVAFRNSLRSLHISRCEWVRQLPRAARILDLGGTDQASPAGALVGMGYPYAFDEVVIVELPPEDRHELYRGAEVAYEAETPLGPVRHVFRSMTDLGCFEDASFDMVVSGQSIEHVTFDEADVVLKDSFRVLRPGGHLALDTPNGRVCRIQQDELTNPDHKYEYTHAEMVEKIERAGFVIESAFGLNYCGNSVRTGVWDGPEFARNRGVYHAIEDCYALSYVARRPAA